MNLQLRSAPSARMACSLRLIVSLVILALFAARGAAAVYHLEGHGNRMLTGPGGISIPGEAVTIMIDLDPANLTPVLLQTDFHFFEPIGPVPFQIVGANSGVYPGVDPVRDLRFVQFGGPQDED